MPHPINRRDFIKSGLLAAAAGTVGGSKAIAQEAEKQAVREQLAKDILNYNLQMQYRPMGRTGVNVSALVRRAIEGGVNYIDTGRVYLGGESEQAVGKALAGGWRDRVYVTSKMPWWEMQSADDFEKFFDQSRRTIGTDVIDFYHIHMIMHRAWKDYVLPYRLIEKMERLKAQGKIRFIGFSFHDSLQLFKQVVEYTPAWDFCLIQHNYLDYEYEAGVLGPKYAATNGLGLAVMKPVRTGFLANLPQVMRDALASTGICKPDTEWALDYLWDIPEVSVAVSGMGSMEDVEENLKYAAKARPNMLSPVEREALGAAIYAYRHAPGHIDCTGCYQCIPCPHNVAIGYIFAYVYNNYVLHQNKERAMADYTVSMSPVQRGDPASSCIERGDPASSCIACGECLAKCPQHLDIPSLLAKVKETMGK